LKDQETKEKFLELRAQGLSFDRIAKKLKASKQTLINWSKELEMEIANRRAIALESLQEKFYMTKARRIEVFGAKFQAIKDELDKRNLSEIPTEKLFDFFIKYSNVLKSEITETVFKGSENFGDTLKKTGETDVIWKP